MPQDPMVMARAVQAIMGQAGAWVARYKRTSPRAAWVLAGGPSPG